MRKEIWTIALAYVGVIVGAGLSSGQDIMQYFVHFGMYGMVGIVLLGLLNVIFGKIIITLGSYYQSDNHQEVLKHIAHPIIHKIIDISLILANFIIGFVMIAGAGANLEQQFSIPSWLGALICVVLIIVVSYMDFEKITGVLGIFTPLILIMLVGITIYSLMTIQIDVNTINSVAKSIESPMKSLPMSVINYYALCAMTGVSMAFVLGGSVLRIGIAEKSGMLGGLLIGVILLCASLPLFLHLPMIKDSNMPMLAIVESISPIFGFVYALTIFALIFNTAFSLFYALARRFDKGDSKRMHILLIGITLAGYVCSFAGFKKLISMMYPLLGYIGIVLLATLAIAWVKEKTNILQEKNIRLKMMKIISKKYRDGDEFTNVDKKIFHALGKESIVETHIIKEEVSDYVEQKIQESK